MCPAQSTISESEFPGYIQIKAIKKAPHSPASQRDNAVTDLVLKDFDLSQLSYSEHFSNMENKYITHKKRLATVNLLLRSDHIPPQTILAEGGFQPKYTKVTPKENEDPDRILNPRAHAVSSTRSGSVSCTWSLKMIKDYSSGDPNYVYLVKAAGGFKGTNFREVECEITVPGGIDSEDIIAFRQLGEEHDPNEFDPDKFLFININFARRYPHLIPYILDRFLEPDEVCLGLDLILNNLPGSSNHSLPQNTSLATIKKELENYFNDSINQLPMEHHERAIAVNNAIQHAKTEDDIWYILENQYALFMNTSHKPIQPLGSTTIPGLKSYYTNSQNINFKESESYLKLIEKALSMMPRADIEPQLADYLAQQPSCDYKLEENNVYIDSNIEEGEYLIGGGEFVDSNEESEELNSGTYGYDNLGIEVEYASKANSPKEETRAEDENNSDSLQTPKQLEHSKRGLLSKKIDGFKQQCDNLIQILNQYETPTAQNKAAIISKASQLLEINADDPLTKFYEYVLHNRKNLMEPDHFLPQDLTEKMNSFTGFILQAHSRVQSKDRFFNGVSPETSSKDDELNEIKRFEL